MDLAELSLNQEFVCMFDNGSDDGPFGPRYHLVHGWRITGALDVELLRLALDDLVTRHDALRTLIVTDKDHRYQRILPPCPVDLAVRDLPEAGARSREEQADAFVQEIETQTISPTQVPLMRAELAKFNSDDAVLALLIHHLATDGWSMRVLIRDLASSYARRKGLSATELPLAPQYRDYAIWQRQPDAGATPAHEYWQRKLAGARITAIPTDMPRSARQPEGTLAHRFAIPASVMRSVSQLARSTRSTPFMVLLAAYQIFLRELTGTADLVVPTFTPGRGGTRFENSVGSFFNFLPLRTDIAGCRTFRDVLERCRRTCLEAYAHDIPSVHIFAEAPELMLPAMADSATAVVFQAFLDPVLLGDEAVGDLRYTEVTRLLNSQSPTSAVPDGALWTLNSQPSGGIAGYVSYKRNLFRQSTIIAAVTAFQQALQDGLSSPDSPLRPESNRKGAPR